MQRRKFGTAARAARDLDIHANVLRKLAKEFPQTRRGPFLAMAQMKPEQLEIERLRREVAELRAERDILMSAISTYERDSAG